jgi:hypothetical protein
MRPDFVDTNQLIERLGMERATFLRLQKRGAAPDPDRHFGGQPLWWWERVEHWKRNRGRSLTRAFGKPLPAVELVDLDGIARRLHVTPQVAGRWRRQGTLVDPDYTWSFGDAWLWTTVEAWAAADRRPRKSKPTPAEPVRVAASPAEDLPSLGELDTLMGRLAKLDDSLALLEGQDRDGLERDVLDQRMRNVASFIDRIDL